MAYNGATICLNGHVVSKSIANSQKHCSMCGKETYSFCPNCKSPIHGLLKLEGVVVVGKRPYSKPFYCYDCGTPYPWTQKILDNAIELLSLDDSLDNDSKELIKNAIPELLIDTPTTPIAAAKYQTAMSKAGQIVKNTMHQLLVDVFSETAKKLLLP